MNFCYFLFINYILSAYKNSSSKLPEIKKGSLLLANDHFYSKHNEEIGILNQKTKYVFLHDN